MLNNKESLIAIQMDTLDAEGRFRTYAASVVLNTNWTTSQSERTHGIFPEKPDISLRAILGSVDMFFYSTGEKNEQLFKFFLELLETHYAFYNG